ncbi:MAG: amino acid adenylation domain-containing protein, partial [bacterium]|nr:amino acid adenylation domain-containing protein [bacterium]
DKLEPRRAPSRNPLFDISMVVRNYIKPDEKPSKKGYRQPEGDRERTNLKPGKNTSKFDMTFFINETPQNIQIDIEYYTGIFKIETIQRLAAHLNNIIKAVHRNPAVKLNEIEMITQREKQQLLYEFNDTAREYPAGKTIHQLFEEQEARTPHAIAIVGTIQDTFIPAVTAHSSRGTGNQIPVTLTYGQLNRNANRQARYLQTNRGIKPGDRVGILMTQTLNRVPAILGILKAGGVYIPLDPALPPGRLKYIINDAGIGVVLTQKKQHPLLETLHSQSDTHFSYNSMEQNGEHLEEPEEARNLNLKIEPTALAYIIYTSGTTGRPKGVILEHRGMANLNTKYAHNFKIGSRDKIIQFANISFDASVSEIFMALLNGAVLHLLDRETIDDYGRFMEYLERHQITVATLPPPYAVNLEVQRLKLRMLITAGSPPNLQFMQKCSRRMEYINAFGPTESTICCSYWSSAWENDIDRISIGKPINNIKLYILSSNMKLQPVGVTGQLCIAGAGLARGYLNNPELTAERFVNNKIQITNKKQEKTREQKSELNNHNTQYPITNNVFYLTGDLARWQPNGNIEYLGRIDHQVKIRGFRIEVGEIENRLLSHEQIKEAVVIVKEGEGDKYLCAYLVKETPAQKTGSEPGTAQKQAAGSTQKPGIDNAAIREYLAQSLPEYMIPSYFLTLEQMPLTPNGKVDKKALPEPDTLTGTTYTAPRDRLEKELVKIWAGVLAIHEELIGIDDNFFRLGGHSLKAATLMTRIHKELEVKVSLEEIFKNLTVKQQARSIKNKKKTVYISLETAAQKEYYHLSSAQKRLYILQQMDEKSTGYNICDAFMLEGTLERDKLENTFQQLIDRHDSLRTSFHMIDGQPLQAIRKPGGITFSVEKFELTEREHTAGEAAGIIKGFIRPFDLSRAPLLRVGLINLREPDAGTLREKDTPRNERHIIIVDMHHSISDGTSVWIFEKEFMALYGGEELAPQTIQYKDYSEWLNSAEARETLKEQETYWLERMTGELPVLELPQDYSRPALQGFEGDRKEFQLRAGETAALNKITRETGVTLYMTLLALFNVFLSKISGMEDIIVGTPTAGRRHPDLETVMGM